MDCNVLAPKLQFQQYKPGDIQNWKNCNLHTGGNGDDDKHQMVSERQLREAEKKELNDWT